MVSLVGDPGPLNDARRRASCDPKRWPRPLLDWQAQAMHELKIGQHVYLIA